MCEINMNSLERVEEYLGIESENFDGQEPPAHWPSSGNIVIENISVRYSSEFPKVLQNVSLEIQSGHKIAVCGRTGSGKSTMALALFRFLEAEEGRVLIDDIDIANVPLKTLRSRLTVIPQHPDLFSGTVRSNLDPFGQHEDADLWSALERCKLATSGDVLAASRAGSRRPSRPSSLHEGDESQDAAVRTVITSLDMAVEQGGKNFSQGQRQLLALARGLLKLRDSRILILDESTASLDAASDAQIQETIRNEMSNATIITVAHRLRTIADFDRVLVLDRGNVLEYDAPYKLLTSPDSAFYDLAQRSGEFDLLLSMAEKKFKGSS
jgi:ABC-type multidrug transport system fused ATPase/permease subunit